MTNDTIYLRMEGQIKLSRPQILISDLGELFSTNPTYNSILKSLSLKNVQGKKSLVTAIEVIRVLNRHFPKATVEILGSYECLVEYDHTDQSRLLCIGKVILGCVLIFFGSAFTIMAFNNDISISELFGHLYELMLGQEKPVVCELEIGYSIGLAIGIIVFFNHIGKKKLSDDVTPIQIEMNKHQKDTCDTIIDKIKEKNNA